LPWQRVVNRSGGLALGYPGGRAGHKAHLSAEGIQFDDNNHIVNLEEVIWHP
jgi:alkylated DNA nucleotide flippase Atl1